MVPSSQVVAEMDGDDGPETFIPIVTCFFCDVIYIIKITGNARHYDIRKIPPVLQNFLYYFTTSHTFLFFLQLPLLKCYEAVIPFLAGRPIRCSFPFP